MKRVLLLLTLLCCLQVTRAQVWQWSVPMFSFRQVSSRAWLWIPPDCKRVRGIVVAQHNMQEFSILENARFREKMGRLGFAELLFSPPFDYEFSARWGTLEITLMLQKLANISGYYELQYAPIVAIGHGVASVWPYQYAAGTTQRTLAAISVSGQWPYYNDSGVVNTTNYRLDNIPLLVTIGEYESAGGRSIAGVKVKKEYPNTALSMLAAPAEGHFAPTQEKIDFIALFIAKAAQYRMPGYNGKGPVNLKPVVPTKMGWLADRWRKGATPRWPAAPVAQYTGDAQQAFWYFDEEMAKAAEAYQARYQHQKVALIAYVQQQEVVPDERTFEQVNLQFLPESDGISFTLSGTFHDTVSGLHPAGEVWTGLPAGSPVGRPKGIVPVTIQPVSGPVEKTGPNRFRLQFRPGMMFQDASYELWFAATHPGDDVYQPAVQQAMMVVPSVNSEGKPQQVTFEPQAIVSRNKKFLPLKATSDAGLPVQYFVAEGPAFTRNDTLFFTQPPPRARYPIQVTVCAWQYGIPGKVQTAVPVYRNINIHRVR